MYPCKACGSVWHIVAITKVRWNPATESIEHVMARGGLKALRVWHRQARLAFTRKSIRLPTGELIARATLTFDFEGDRDIVITYYPRKRAVDYPPGQPT